MRASQAAQQSRSLWRTSWPGIANGVLRPSRGPSVWTGTDASGDEGSPGQRLTGLKGKVTLSSQNHQASQARKLTRNLSLRNLALFTLKLTRGKMVFSSRRLMLQKRETPDLSTSRDFNGRGFGSSHPPCPPEPSARGAGNKRQVWKIRLVSTLRGWSWTRVE